MFSLTAVERNASLRPNWT